MARQPGRQRRRHRFLPGRHCIALGFQADHRPVDGSLRVPANGQKTAVGTRCTTRPGDLVTGAHAHRATRGADRPPDADRHAHQQLRGDPGRCRRWHVDRPHPGQGAGPPQCLHEFRQDHRLGRDRRRDRHTSHQLRTGDDRDHCIGRCRSRPVRHARRPRARG